VTRRGERLLPAHGVVRKCTPTRKRDARRLWAEGCGADDVHPIQKFGDGSYGAGAVFEEHYGMSKYIGGVGLAVAVGISVGSA
jgi:hypothetical protein